jgi:hypothetical protein
MVLYPTATETPMMTIARIGSEPADAVASALVRGLIDR